MKRIFILLGMLSYLAFGYNFNGTWINKTGAGFNEPVKLVIKGDYISPTIKRGSTFYKLKTKAASRAANGYFEVWGFKNKSMALFITPNNSRQIEVLFKKINPNRKSVITKRFIFARKGAPVNLRQFTGSYHSRHNNLFTAISRVTIFKEQGRLYVKAWRNTPRGERALGVARARLKGDRLYMVWEKRNIYVKANIKGIKKNAQNRFKKIQLNIEARNLRTNVYNRQTIILKRDRYRAHNEPVDQIERAFDLVLGY
jgi:hypothetical protein